jgi:hypothetical protein
VADDIRGALLARRAWRGIALASALVVGGHAVTFLIAARTAGTLAPPSQMLPIALLAMMAMVVYGVMVLVATLPGALVLVLTWFRDTKLPQRSQRPLREEAAHA